MRRPSLRPVVRRRNVVRLLSLLLVAVAAGACQLTTEVNVTVEPDGSGTVEVGVGLDEDALSRRPDVLDELALGDLVDAGWVVTGPAEEDDDLTWIRAAHDFTSPDEVGGLVDQIAGADGPFRDFAVERDVRFAETRYRFSGSVDFTGGIEGAVADPELAEALGGEPIELLEERLGDTVDRLVAVQVAVRLPGDVDSNATTRASNGAVWRPSVLEPEPLELVATSTVRRSERYVWLGVAVVAGLALVLFLSIRLASWRRSRRPSGGVPSS